jgi:AraC-like DNA-binding protein
MTLAYTEPAILALPVIQAATQVGAPSEPLLAAAGLSQDELATPFMPIASECMCALLGEVARLTGDPAFAVRMMERTTPGDFGMIAYSIVTRPTLGMAVHQGLHVLTYFRSAVPPRVEERGRSMHIVLDSAGPDWPHRNRYAEYALGMCMDLLRKSSGQRLRPHEVGFSHAEDEAAPAMRGYFGCTVRYDQPRTELVFPAEWFGFPCARADPELADLLADTLDRGLQPLEQQGPRLADLARTAVAHALRNGGADLGAVSRRLGLRPRSLQHLLHKEGATFAAVLDEERKQRALELLRGPEALDAVAWRLGYQGAATFIRAFRRWTGQTPAQYRRSQQETPSPC